MIPKNKTIFAMLFLIATIISCDVDRIPETSLSDASYWKSENDVKLAANYLYTSLPALNASVINENWSDNAFGNSANSISDGTRIAPATDNDYNSNYTIIRAANNLMEKSSRVLVNGVSQTTLDKYIGEAKYFRARAYFNLLQRFGGVPLILKVLQENSPELQAPQATRDEVINSIYADLDDAISKLRTRTQLTATDYGRISKTAALALKAQVGLFEGTRTKFHGYGNPVKHLTIAKNAAKQVMDSNEHGLFNNYFQLWQYEGEGFANKENILVRQYGKNITDDISSHSIQRNLEQGFTGATKALIDSYLMKDGLPTTKSSLYKTPTKHVEVFSNRDPRMGAKFLKFGDMAQNGVPFPVVIPLNFLKTGYGCRFYLSFADWSAQKSYIDLPVTRYAEILLIYAEATFELTGSISDSDLDLSINLLRQRPTVVMPKLTNAFVTTNGLDMRTEIRRERRIELAFEGFRYWDLIRWKTAEIELPKEVLGSFFFSEFGTSVKPIVDANNFIICQKGSTRKFDPDRDYLWPFPNNELSLNPNLKQNPKW